MHFEKHERVIDGQRYLRLCKSSTVVHRHGTHVYVDIETDLALFRVGEKVVAYTNICPHKREATIAQGNVMNNTVTCPMHGWCFDLDTGKNVGVGAGLKRYDVLDRDGYVWLAIPEE